jgi:hypothetical protein
MPRFNPKAHTAACHDNNTALAARYGKQYTCLAAAAAKACQLSGIATMCGCSCGTHEVLCKDDDAGLRKMYGGTVSCVQAASTGACSKGPFTKVVAKLCTCACKSTSPPGQHRRLQRSAGQIDASEINLGFSHSCPWDSFNDRLYTVTKICCPKGGCSKQIPSRCSFDCGHQFSAFMKSCGALFSALIVGVDHGLTKKPMKPYTDFLNRCQNLDPRSLATAVYGAKCAECGNGKVESWFHEQCDDGPKNSFKPNACRPVRVYSIWVV